MHTVSRKVKSEVLSVKIQNWRVVKKCLPIYRLSY